MTMVNVTVECNVTNEDSCVEFDPVVSGLSLYIESSTLTGSSNQGRFLKVDSPHGHEINIMMRNVVARKFGRSDVDGGVLYAADHYGGDVYVSLVNVDFSYNRGNSGGSIFVEAQVDHIKVYIIDSKFTENTASKVGGAGYFSHSEVMITGCSFENNTAISG